MPTATTTMSFEEVAPSTSVLSLKPSKAAESSTAATLRSLYTRAAKAFLHRDFSLTHSLLTSAFALIAPPTYSTDDEIATFRRKWDILRITVETTVYSSPPSSDDADAFPAALRANQLLSPQSLVTSFHSRSLQLFTPSSPPQKPRSTFLPHQVLTALVFSSIKLDCFDVGRGMIEDWLARRTPGSTKESLSGYTQIMELYCLHVLPKLEEWQYAEEFLQYETELGHGTRENMKLSLRAIHKDSLEARNLRTSKSLVATPPLEVSPSSTRPASPARSTSSDSSASTHTATPSSPHPASKGKSKTQPGKNSLNGLTHLTPSSPAHSSSELSSSDTLSSTATSRTVTPRNPHRSRSTSRRELNKRETRESSRNDSLVAIRTTASTPASPSGGTIRAPSTLAVIRAYIDTSLRNATRSKLVVFFFVFVLFPAISLAIRIRRRNSKLSPAGQHAIGAADVVRRRLRATPSSTMVGTGLVGSLWHEVMRSIGDTIRMGGSGLA
ncbi:hypothetical protein BDW22DRAFT_1357166 [Trametopsis cervina]|nr:hypothetical protein BDW22DRAFT_1357166 [Trametopsis cervina]